MAQPRFTPSGIFARMISPEEPLGPYVTPQNLQDKKNKVAFNQLFDDQNYLSKENLKLRPNILLGRRGSGKTAFLFHLRFSGFDFVSKIESETTFEDVAQKIVDLFQESHNPTPVVETIARLWRKILLTTVICNFYNRMSTSKGIIGTERISTIEVFLKKGNLINRRSPKMITKALIRLAEVSLNRNFDFFEDFLEDYFENEIGFLDAWEASLSLMEECNINGIVLIDSLEQFPISRSDMCHSLSGLLHFVGEFDLEYSPIHIAVCLPAELHEEFKLMSANVEKDFRKMLSLHWDPVDLFQMCGHRFNHFVSKCRPAFGSEVKFLPDKPNREEVWDYWYQFMPRTISNRYGVTEDPIAYISRHTQLLPRHFINIFNKIAMISFAGRNGEAKFTEDDILRGVRLGEGIICEGVLNGFEQKYPVAIDVCKLIIPNLDNMFDYNLLRRINRQYGKGVVKDTGDLLDMLVRMGVVGKFVDRSEHYRMCRFDYTYNGTMPYSVEDTFGIHPAFTGQYGSVVQGSEVIGDRRKPIYPIEKFTAEPNT